MFSFTSIGGQIDHPINRGRGTYTFRMGGQNAHLIGCFLPNNSAPPKLCQLYIYDTEEELTHRKNALSSTNLGQFDDGLISEMARDRIEEGVDGEEVRLSLIRCRKTYGRTYNLPTISEVAALIVGDIDNTIDGKDIIVEERGGNLQQDGHRLGIPHSGKSIASPNNLENSRDKLTLREWFAFCRLFKQFCVDGYTMIESKRLAYLRFNQPKLRSENYKNLAGAVANGQIEPSSVVIRYIIPSTFLGGKGYMRETYQDTMTICKWCGYLDLFITFTCNPKWPEITRFVTNKGVKPEDRPDILTRVALVYTIEFQKCGFSYAHILLFLHRDDKFPEAADVDRIISAEIPDPVENPFLHEAVRDLMIHGPCGAAKPNLPTTIDGDGYPIYRRRDNGVTSEKSGIRVNNGYVVPYNPDLLSKYHAHINVEWCNLARSIWSDRVTVSATHSSSPFQIDQIQEIFSFDIHYRTPPVFRLDYHLPNDQNVILNDDDPIDKVVARSNSCKMKFNSLLGYYLTCLVKPSQSWSKCGQNLVSRPKPRVKHMGNQKSYHQIVLHVWKKKLKKWKPRKQGFSLGKMYHMSPNGGERYYMRTILNFVRGPKSDEDIRTINGVVYPTFKEACHALGLLGDDKEYIDAIIKASFWGTGLYLRNLFSTLLLSIRRDIYYLMISCTRDAPNSVIMLMSFTNRCSIVSSTDLQLNDVQLQNYALAKIEAWLQSNGSSLRKFNTLPFSDYNLNSEHANKLISDELSYDNDAFRREHVVLTSSMTSEQKSVYTQIMDAVENGNGGVFLFMALDRSLRDIMRFSPSEDPEKPFGGKVIVFGGDFRQILHVAPKGSRQDIVYASISFSPLWRFCKVLKLTQNMPLEVGSSKSNTEEIRQFSEWILQVRDGLAEGPNDSVGDIEVRAELLIHSKSDPIAAIVKSTYPSLNDHLGDPHYFKERAVLAPTQDILELVNEYVLSLIPNEERVYLSSDEISKEENNIAIRLTNHNIKLKVGAIVMLLRNIAQANGLCNGTRLVVTNIGDRVIRATILSGNNNGIRVYIPRITLTPSDTTNFLVRFERRQFPLTVCFTLTIKKSHGQSLSQVGLYLLKPVFTHGQLYVAISRVTNKQGLKVLISDEENATCNTTSNFVYKEIFQNF
ncbi:hypothetical protein RND81_13G078500 [Saponaria officinalis]|uniref:ATP-dependent DNA helicase n=1 Tax=Saponaria officinalis TaxID=3572 RepID=A0AAW1GYB1_SAPOF